MKELITAFVPTSPVPSNPSTNIIDHTLDSIQHWFPDINIFLMCDGVRKEQEDRLLAYRQFYYCLLFEKRVNMRFFQFIRHRHQVGLMREFIRECSTPLILFCEHDTPLVVDEPIDWLGIVAALTSGVVDFVRFLPEANIHPEHEYLMRGPVLDVFVPLTKTIQFSARPHLATKEFYLRLLGCFSPEANSFIEDKMHSICQDQPWEQWKMAIFTPPGNMKRSLHLDGRAGADKYDDQQLF